MSCLSQKKRIKIVSFVRLMRQMEFDASISHVIPSLCVPNHDLMRVFSILCYMCVYRINKHPDAYSFLSRFSLVNALFHRYLFTIIK